MENKIKKLHKIMSVVLVASLFFWSITTYGLLSMNTGFLVALLLIVAYANKKYQADERDMQIYTIAAYGSFITTIIVLLITQTVSFIKSHQVNPLFGQIIGVLLLSHLAFYYILKKIWK